MKFKNSSIHRLKISKFTEKWKNQSKFQIPVILSLYGEKFLKVKQVIYFSAKISIPNMKAVAQTLFEISCTILFSKGHNSEKGHNGHEKIWVNYFFS